MSNNPNLQPTLTGQRVIVRPILADDWQATFAVAADPKIWEGHPATDRYTESVFRGFFDGAVRSGSAFVFLDRATKQVIGSSRYNGYDQQLSEIEIGWTFLTRAYWGGSYNCEIKTLMLDHAFNFVETVIFWVGEQNIRSRRAMEKIGGTLREGTQVRSAADDTPHVIYEMRR